ncbi:hypothetical protein GA0115261_100833 [Streptomyces sp. OspMP-M43]|nr:hypothetical protein GA0115261_100833 [Streptomyces sp. OspMP-M43]
MSSPCFGLKVRDLLLGHSGFPDLRVQWSLYPDTCLVVEWGERPPKLGGDRDATTLGRFYGYSEAAIAAFGAAEPRVPLFGRARTVFPHGTVVGRRGPNLPPERTSIMCAIFALPHGRGSRQGGRAAPRASA